MSLFLHRQNNSAFLKISDNNKFLDVNQEDNATDKHRKIALKLDYFKTTKDIYGFY